MDKNTIIGLVIIFLILIGFSYLNRPSEEQRREMMRRDSIARVEQQQQALEAQRLQEERENTEHSATGTSTRSTVFAQDSLAEQVFTLENDKIKLNISTRGGRITTVDLKEYCTHDSLPLLLWQEQTSSFGMTFYARNQEINTERFLFVPSTMETALYAKDNAQTLAMRLYADSTKYIEYRYTLAPDSYMADFSIVTHDMGDVIASNSSFLTLHWGVNMPQLEKSKDFESRYTGVYYKFFEDDVEHLSLTSAEDEETLPTKVQWIDFKQQFFSSILITETPFSDILLSSKTSQTNGFIKDAYAEIPLPYNGNPEEKYDMRFFFGPNSFPVLKEYGKDIDLTDVINTGWKWVAWFNKYFVIPIFNFLQNNTSWNYGIIILVLTLIIKIILFPLTYKSYMSSAKMRVLKPQLDEINKKYPADKALEKQQAMMKLYKQAGINPMGGCLPLLLQMPILIALFYFFPGAIELRQQGFLWADDLASYDSIATLPFTIPFYGSHVSLFCLLMTATNIIYTVINYKNQPQNDQMKGMKMMMYLMPIMFLFIFNNYSSGLSYYYFIATLITIFQTWIIRMFVNEEKLLKRIELAKQKPMKKSRFQQRLEEMQKQQQQRLREQQRMRNKK